MAPGAGDGQSHAPSDNVDPVIDDIILVIQEPPAQGKEP
jgi:hypothetical protein